MKKLVLLIALSSLIAAAVSCKEKQEEKILTKEVVFTKHGELQLKKSESDSIVASLDIEIADDEYETQTGLMYRKGMRDDRGMFFIFKDESRRSFYMKNTEFSLDLLFINSNNVVVCIKKNALPFDQSPLPCTTPSVYVLEVNAGLTDKWNVVVGDKIDFTRME